MGRTERGREWFGPCHRRARLLLGKVLHEPDNTGVFLLGSFVGKPPQNPAGKGALGPGCCGLSLERWGDVGKGSPRCPRADGATGACIKRGPPRSEAAPGAHLHGGSVPLHVYRNGSGPGMMAEKEESLRETNNNNYPCRC